VASEEERSSKLGDSEPPPILSPDEIALREAENTLKQYDRLVELIRGSIVAGRLRLRPSTLMELNRLAVDGLVKSAGAFRHGPIEILGSTHEPPPWHDVATLIDDMCEYVNDSHGKSPIHLAAYVMWRVNWIHPFADGNGRTSRAASYYVLCAGLGQLLPGPRTIPERIAAKKQPYWKALEAADQAWEVSKIDVSAMEELLKGLLAAQLLDVHKLALGEPLDPLPEPPGPAWGGAD
jgi:Fic family protein